MTKHERPGARARWLGASRTLGSALARAPLTTCLVISACHGPETGREVAPSGVVEWDSAGVLIVETGGGFARTPLAWAVGPTPALQIGAEAGERAYLLHGIGGVAELPDGRILVVDGGSRELRFFGRDGGFQRAIGGEGDGPGRFRAMPWLVPSAAYDSLLVFDRGLQRFSVFSAEGELLRTHASLEVPVTQIPTPTGRTPLRGVSGTMGTVDGRVLTFRTTSVLTSSAGLQPANPFEVRSIDVTGAGEAVGLFEGERWFHTPQDDLGQVGRFRLAFDAAPSASASRDGFYLTLGKEPEIREIDASGRLRRLLRLDEAPRLVTDRDLQDYIEVVAATTSIPALRNLYRAEYRRVESPEVFPGFEALVVDALGWVWARAYGFDPASPAVWLVFDPEGRGRGSVALPARLEVHQIGSDFVLGSWKDELDIEYVRRYTLSRAGGGEPRN